MLITFTTTEVATILDLIDSYVEELGMGGLTLTMDEQILREKIRTILDEQVENS